MKALSLMVNGRAIVGGKDASLETQATERGFAIAADKKSFFEFPFNGSEVSKLESDRSLAGGAIGAVAGGLLLGPLGLVGGGLLGSRKRHTYVVKRGDDIAILELSNTEEKELLTRGFTAGGKMFPLGRPFSGKGVDVSRHCVTCGDLRGARANVPSGSSLIAGLVVVLGLALAPFAISFTKSLVLVFGAVLVAAVIKRPRKPDNFVAICVTCSGRC